jgi:hypothetical protein
MRKKLIALAFLAALLLGVAACDERRQFGFLWECPPTCLP